jgi:hypothetical protein
MLIARLMPENFPEPTPLDPETEPTDEQQREYNRAVEARAKNLAAVADRVLAFNRRHCRWLYVLDETIVQRAIPELEGLKSSASVEAPAKPKPENSESANGESVDGAAAVADSPAKGTAEEESGGEGG